MASSLLGSKGAKDLESSEVAPIAGAKSDVPEGLEPVGGFCGGLANDVKKRYAWYYSDIVTDGLTAKTISATLFMFFATFTSTVALGSNVNAATNGLIGLNEYLMMNSMAGIWHALFGVQPLLVVRPTGPITLLIEKLYAYSSSLGLPFWPLFAWTGLFVGFYSFLVAAFELSWYMVYVSPFVEDIFAFFIGTVYTYDGIYCMIDMWQGSLGDGTGSVAAGEVVTINLTLSLTAVALFLATAKHWRLFSYNSRQFMADYALTIACFFTVLIGCYINSHQFKIEFLDTSSLGWTTTDERSWRSNLLALNFTGVCFAAVAAIPIVIFFYIDQNVSSSACQKPELKLRKGSYYHASFACIGFLCSMGPLFGLPFVTGSLPHSPQFVRSLADTDKDHKITGVRENRLAPFFCYLLIGLPLLAPGVLSVVPQACVGATLLFVGLDGIANTQIYERLTWMLMEERAGEASRYNDVPMSEHLLLLIIEIALIVGTWACNDYLSLFFPLFVALFVPIRWCVLPRIFSEQNIKIMASEE